MKSKIEKYLDLSNIITACFDIEKIKNELELQGKGPLEIEHEIKTDLVKNNDDDVENKKR